MDVEGKNFLEAEGDPEVNSEGNDTIRRLCQIPGLIAAGEATTEPII